jgi:tetratricopeptide (TPR) repeat protein
MWKYLIHESQRLPYRPNGIDLYFFRILQLMVQEDAQHEALLAAIENQIQKYQQENRTATPLLLAKLTALEQAGKQTAAQQFTSAHLNEPDVLQYAIAQAQKKDLRPRVKALAETGLKLNFNSAENAKLEDLLLQMAEEEQDQALIYQYAISRFKNSLDISYYSKAKQHATAAWNEQVEALLQWLSSRPYSMQRQEAIASIYRQENRPEDLMVLLEKTSSILLLMKFSHTLMPDYQERLFSLYKRLIDQYTNQHLGRKAAGRVSEVITHLFKDGAPELAYEIISKLRNTYPERHTLMEALTEFE